MKFMLALGLLLLTATVHAQNLPSEPEAANTGDFASVKTNDLPAKELISSSTPVPVGTESETDAHSLPDKLEPAPAHFGQWISVGEPMGVFSNDMIITERKDDGRTMWHVERVDSCAWCGKPMTWKQAAFDKKASSLWMMRTGTMVADIEITHHAPCFLAGTCREANPLLGQTRAQGYAVAGTLTALCWLGDAYVRKGDQRTHIGGYRFWWVVGPIVGTAASGGGIIANLARWHK